MDEQETVKHIDLSVGLRLANNNNEMMMELLQMLVEDLNEVKESLKKASTSHDVTLLKNIVHRLYGASCYCGVPLLKKTCGDMQNVLRENTDYTSVLVKLDHAIEGVIADFEILN